ncbi:MAG: spore coat protein U domain-containing protein [Deltaproteobacteria bacterium]|nr:spore coat protein U domain-containing protein [Deltaproteobacteria bacterium]
MKKNSGSIYTTSGLAVFFVFILVFSPVVGWCDCNVSSTGVNFGTYNPLDTFDLDSSGSIMVSCTSNVSVMVSISVSPTSGGFNPRKIRQSGGSDTLNYNLYTTSNRAAIWGDGTQGTEVVWHGVKKKSPWSATVYGRISAAQDVYVGQYGESLVVQIDY